MYIETIYQLKVKDHEQKTLTDCHMLLEEILSECKGSDLQDITFEDIAFASDVLLRLITDMEVY